MKSYQTEENLLLVVAILKLPVPASLIGYRELTLGTRVLSNQKPSF
jgi:hypothetical protein